MSPPRSRAPLAYQRVLQLADLSSDITTLVQRLQDERDQTAYFIAQGNAGRGQPGAPGLQVVYTQRHDTERAAAEVAADLEQIGGSFPPLARQEAQVAARRPGQPAQPAAGGEPRAS